MSWTVERIRSLTTGNMLGLIGFEPITVEHGRCLASLEGRADLLQPMGVFHTGAFVTLADAATYAALTLTDPEATLDPARFPLAVQVSTNLVGNASGGRITAEARVTHPGRTTQVVSTEVRDEKGWLLALVTTTHLVLPARQR